MKNLIIIILTAIICISATHITDTVIAIPSPPKIVRHGAFKDINKADEYVGQCVRDGYTIKCVSGAAEYQWFVVAEKY